MPIIQLSYQGDLHCKAVHAQSGTEFSTEAPVDNESRRESLSPAG